MPIENRLKRLESLLGQKLNGDYSRGITLSEEEMKKVYQEAACYLEPLYIKKGPKYIAIEDLDSSEMQKSYREFIDGRIRIYSESELKQMGIETNQTV